MKKIFFLLFCIFLISCEGNIKSNIISGENLEINNSLDDNISSTGSVELDNNLFDNKIDGFETKGFNK